MDLDEPPLQAEIMMSSSMTESLILSLPLCTMKTSLSRIDVSAACELLATEQSTEGGPRTNLHRRLSIRELAQRRRPALRAQAVADAVYQRWVRRAAEDYGAAHDGRPEEKHVVVVAEVQVLVLASGKLSRHN